MNFLQQLRQLDFNDIGRWPGIFHAFFVGIFFVVVAIGGFYMMVWKNQMPLLEKAEREERELRQSFEQKQKKAANFTAYKTQLAEMERSFGTMLRQLPSKTEVAELLVDISQTGLQSGLEFELFKPEGERPADFYAELPIKIKVAGSYHEFGQFVSDVAALPRIVTLQDFSIGPLSASQGGKKASQDSKKGDKKAAPATQDMLIMEVTAKTFRYLDEQELLDEEGGAS